MVTLFVQYKTPERKTRREGCDIDEKDIVQ